MLGLHAEACGSYLLARVGHADGAASLDAVEEELLHWVVVQGTCHGTDVMDWVLVLQSVASSVLSEGLPCGRVMTRSAA